MNDSFFDDFTPYDPLDLHQGDPDTDVWTGEYAVPEYDVGETLDALSKFADAWRREVCMELRDGNHDFVADEVGGLSDEDILDVGLLTNWNAANASHYFLTKNI